MKRARTEKASRPKPRHTEEFDFDDEGGASEALSHSGEVRSTGAAKGESCGVRERWRESPSARRRLIFRARFRIALVGDRGCIGSGEIAQDRLAED